MKEENGSISSAQPLIHSLAFVLLCGWLVLAWQAAGDSSVTHDELWHLPVGVLNWQGDFAADRLNPPLSRMWAALPLVFSGVEVSPAENGPEVGNRFVLEHDDFQSWYVAARRWHLVWGLAAAVLVYGWACRVYGAAAGLLCVAALLTCPEVLAHSALVTPDVPAMTAFLLTGICLAAWLAQPKWSWAVLLGLALGVLQGIKFTGVVFYPSLLLIAVGLMVQAYWNRKRENSVSLRLIWGQLAMSVVISLLVLGMCYGFQGWFQPLSGYTFQSSFLQHVQSWLGPLAKLPVPLPADYLLGVDQQRAIMESPHPIYLDGLWQLSGFPTYFLKALLYKLPHLFQLLILLGLLMAWRDRSLRDRYRWLALGLPAGLLFVLASLSDMQLGLRYILPVIPLLALSAGPAVKLLEGSSRLTQGVGLAVVVVVLMTSLRFHPQHLPYFNELAGGPIGGRYHLLDSNLDWGQDLLRARDFIAEHPDENPRMVYFGSLDPRRVGVQVDLPPSWEPEPGLYLVSVNYVMGRPHTAWQQDGTKRSIDFMEFGYFQYFEPIARAGYSIDVYRITEQDLAADR